MAPISAPPEAPPTATSTSTAPVSSASTPHLDLKPQEEARAVVDVDLKYSAVAAGIRTHTCPQCGVNPAGAPVTKKWQFVPGWVYLGMLANILVLLIMYSMGKRTVSGELNLCADCDQADSTGRTLRSASVWAVVVFPFLFASAGFIGGGEAALVGAVVGLVAGCTAAFAAHRRTRFDVITCRFIDKKADKVTLRGSPALRRVIAKDAPGALFS